MTSETIFGSGNMGNAIAGVLAAGGADVEHICSAQGVQNNLRHHPWRQEDWS